MAINLTSIKSPPLCLSLTKGHYKKTIIKNKASYKNGLMAALYFFNLKINTTLINPYKHEIDSTKIAIDLGKISPP